MSHPAEAPGLDGCQRLAVSLVEPPAAANALAATDRDSGYFKIRREEGKKGEANKVIKSKEKKTKQSPHRPPSLIDR